MRNAANIWLLLPLAVSLLAGGCGAKPPASEGHGHPGAEEEARDGGGGDAHGEAPGAEFKPGSGIRLGEAARKALGLETAEVSQRKLALAFSATARVFHAAHQHGSEFPGHKDGHAYANAMIHTGTADLLRVGQQVELEASGRSPGALQAVLSSLDRETARAIGQVEAVIEIPDPEGRLDFGAFLTVRFLGVERSATVIPRSALVDAATGTFVYVSNGERWLRTAVKVGGSSEQFVEILDGLVEGDVVVSRGAVDLWLVELRFTKGGGHSH